MSSLPDAETPRRASVVVIGAGQAGLSAAYHLLRRGFSSALTGDRAEPARATADETAGAAATPAARTVVVLDAATAPGGAWQHRWESLTMATVNGIFGLPGFPTPPVDGAEPSRIAVPRYFAAYEEQLGAPIVRPVTVTSVRRVDDDPRGELEVAVTTPAGQRAIRTRAVINATGTWTNPLLPRYPGAESFGGRQLHTRDYVSAEEFRGMRVGIVGGGISAIQQLEEISRVADTRWYTRREPVFLEGEFSPEHEGRATIERVTADVEAGLPSGSIVSYTGLAWTSYAVAARERGALERHPMFSAIEPGGVREADGSFTPLDAILWATGFRPALAHLAPLGLQNELGGIPMAGTRVVADPRIHLIGFGPSQSTVGANRAGRDAVGQVVRMLGAG